MTVIRRDEIVEEKIRDQQEINEEKVIFFVVCMVCRLIGPLR